jgi:hypothetical protein
MAALEEEIRRAKGQLAALRAESPINGVWFSPDPANVRGKFIRQGQLVGQVIADEEPMVLAKMGQDQAAALLGGVKNLVEMRVKERPDLEFFGEIVAIHPAGKKELPTPAMGIPAGGETQVDPGDQQGLTSQEHFFEIEVKPFPPEKWTLRQGQMLALRFSASPKSGWQQAKRALRQMFQRRFSI